MIATCVRRTLTGIIACALASTLAVSCTIPTEERPQPITREQTTTIVESP